MAEFYGIAVYEIKENGNLLHAVYTNNTLRDAQTDRFDIDTEIARKIPNNNEGLTGVYNCRYIVTQEQEVFEEQLTITKREEVYEFKWTFGNRTIFVGLGMMAGVNHIAVSYTRP